MRTLLLALICGFSLLSFSQIPNGGLDQWDMISIPQIEDWSSLGNVSQTSDAASGDYAIRLDNDLATATFGAFSNTEISEEFEGGQPYDEIPLSMTFQCKYDFPAGDTGQLLAFFKLLGQPIGLVDFKFFGNSNGEFITVNYPIQWITQIQPDTLAVVVSSVNLATPSFNGDGYLIIDNIQFKNFSTQKDSVLNPSFERWTEFSIQHPEHWYTSDLYILDQFNQAKNFNSVTNPVHIHSGSGAMKLQNIEIQGQVLPGVAITGKGLEGIEEPTFEVDRKWKHIHGLYKYAPSGGDVATVAALMYSNGTLIGAAQLQFTDSTRLDQYTYFSAAITYFAAGTPDSATVVVGAADLETAQSVNTQFWVDNLTFTDHTAGLDELTAFGIEIYPNPATDIIQFKDLSNDAEVKVTNSIGQVIYHGNSHSLIVSKWPSGMYHVAVKENGEVKLAKLIKL